MKRVLALVLTLALCLGLVGCGNSSPSLEELVEQADQIVRDCKSDYYKFVPLGYEEETNTYIATVMVDTEKITQLIKETVKEDAEEYLVELATEVALSNHETNTDAIDLLLTDLKLSLETNFIDTDVGVRVGFVNRAGEVTKIAYSH